MVTTEGVVAFEVQIVQRMRQHALDENLKGCYEAVGFMARARGMELITAYMPLNNHCADPTTGFFVEPWEQFRAERKLAERGYEIMGVFHSHPTSEALPSKSDSAMARPGELMVIYSVAFDTMNVYRENNSVLTNVRWEQFG